MNLDAILEVAIGLVFTWLVLSVATMQIQEWISSIFHWRAELLEETIRKMLGDDLAKSFYEHSIINSLSQPRHKPSYIPSDLFALTSYDVLFNKAKETDQTPASRKPLLLKDVKVKGIGPDSIKRLNKASIHTVDELAAITPDRLREIIHPGYAQIVDEEEILKYARELLKSVDSPKPI